MSMTVVATIVNPDSLNTIEDLRRELHRTNETLMQQIFKIADLNEAGSQVVGALNKLLIMHIKQDVSGMAECLDAYLAERPTLREALEEQSESVRMRKVH